MFRGSSPTPSSPTLREKLHPYLGPHARLSLSWLSQHFLALLLVLLALGFLLASIPDLVQDGKIALTSACQGVEGAGNVAVSLPHYMADGINNLNSKTISAVTQGVGTILDLTLQALQAIIIFIIDTYRSLFLCLLDLVVHGSLTLLVGAIEEAQQFVSEAISKVRDGLQVAVQGVNSGLEKTIGLIDKIPGVDVDVPTIDVPELSNLENVTIPSTVVSALVELNSSIPTLEEFRVKMNSLISTPIEALRSNISTTLSNRTVEVEMLPVPSKQTVEICTGLDTAWIDDVGNTLGTFIKVSMGLIVLSMVLCALAGAIWEHYSYRSFIRSIMSAREAWLRDLLDETTDTVPSITAREALSKPNLLAFINASSHPLLFSFVRRLRKMTSLRSTTAKVNLIWFCSYIAHPHAWAFLTLGIVGLSAVQIQLWALNGPVKHLSERRADEGAAEFSDSVVTSLNRKMNESSHDFATRSNQMILSVQDGINRDLFGWINGTTEALNMTIVGFYDGLTSAISDVFEGTPLESPVLNLIYCLVGSKVDAISGALSWLHSHAHLSLPTLSPTILMLNANRSRELTDGLTSPDSAVSATSIVKKMLRAYERSLEQQRLGFFLAIAIWNIVVLSGMIGVAWRSGGAAKWDSCKARIVKGGGFGRAEGKEKVGMSEKSYVRPLNLRNASTVKQGGRKSGTAEFSSLNPPAKRPAASGSMSVGVSRASNMACDIDSLASFAEEENDLRASAASWASLVDFFRPTSANITSPTSNLAEAEVSHKRSPLQNVNIQVPRAFRSDHASALAKFKPRPFNISRPRPSSGPRRDSDLINLRTGEYVSRSVPAGSRGALGGFGEKARGIREDFSARLVKTMSPIPDRKVNPTQKDPDRLDCSWNPPVPTPTWRSSVHTELEQASRFSFLPYVPPKSSSSRHRSPGATPVSPNSPVLFTETLLRGHRLAVDPFSVTASSELGNAHRTTNPFASPLYTS